MLKLKPFSVVLRGFLSVAVCVLPASAFSDDSFNVSTNLSLTPSLVNGTNPKSAAAMYGGILVSCQNAQAMTGEDVQKLGEQIASYFGASPTPSSSGTPSCGLPSMISATFPCKEVAVPTVPNSCDSFKSGGSLDKAKLKNALLNAEAAACSNTCRRLKLQAINEEMKCLSQQSDQVVQQLTGQLQQAYTSNVQRFQQELGSIKADIKDRQAQLEFVQGRIGGDKVTGEEAWVKLQSETKAAYDAMNAEIAKVTEAQKSSVMQQASVLEQSELTRASSTSACFLNRIADTNAAYESCPFRVAYKQGAALTGGTVAVNNYEYILCRYWQESHRGKGGSYESYDASVRAAALNRTMQLKQVLDDIFGNAARGYKVPMKEDELKAQGDQPMGSLVPAMVDEQYGSRLQAFSANGLDIRGFVLQALAACDALAVKEVAQASARVNKPLGRAIEGAKMADRALCSQVEGLFDKYSQVYSGGISGLTGLNLPLDVSFCRQSSDCKALEACKGDMVCRQKAFNMQTSCLKDLRRNLEGLLRGNTPNSNVQILVQGQNAKNNVQFECLGINGCIRKAQNLARELDRENKRLDQTKSQYVMKANQSIEAFTRQMASALGPTSQAINNRLKELNSALAGYGSGASIKISGMKADKLEKDEDGLLKLPENPMKHVGGSANPPLLDVSGDNFTDSISGLDKAQTKVNEDATKLSEAVNNAQNLMASCPKEGLKDKASELESLWSGMDSRCAYDQKYCEGSEMKSDLRNILNAVQGYDLGQAGVDPSVITNIDSGIAGLCSSGPMPTPSPTPTTGQIANPPVCASKITQIKQKLQSLKTKMDGAGIGNSAVSGE